MSPVDFKWVVGMLEEVAKRSYEAGYADGENKRPRVQRFAMSNATKLWFKKLHQEFANPPRRR